MVLSHCLYLQASTQTFPLPLHKHSSFHFLQSYLATRRPGELVTTSLSTSQRRRRYVSNETPNDLLMERRQDISVIRLHDIWLERCDGVSRGYGNDVPSVRFHDVSNKSQMKHPRMSQWCITKASQWYVSAASQYYVSTTSPVGPKWNTKKRHCGTSPPRFGVMLLSHLVNKSLLRF